MIIFSRYFWKIVKSVCSIFYLKIVQARFLWSSLIFHVVKYFEIGELKISTWKLKNFFSQLKDSIGGIGYYLPAWPLWHDTDIPSTRYPPSLLPIGWHNYFHMCFFPFNLLLKESAAKVETPPPSQQKKNSFGGKFHALVMAALEVLNHQIFFLKSLIRRKKIK